MADAVSVKRAFIQAAIARAAAGHYPLVEPTIEDRSRDLAWWIRVFDAKAFLFSENGSAAWLFPPYQLLCRPLAKRVVVSFAGKTLADSPRCFEFLETAHPSQIYVPKSEVDFSCLQKSSTLTYCPFKNVAGYYSVRVGDQSAEDAFWCYEDVYEPLPPSGNADGVLQIKGLLSPDREKLQVQLL